MFKVIEMGGRGRNVAGRDIENSLGYSCYTHKKGHSSGQVSFYIGNKLMKKARFEIGDRLQVLIDEEAKLGVLKRVPDNTQYSWKISGKRGKCSKISLLRGKLFPECPVVKNLENITLTDDGIVFVWPSA